MMKMNRWLTLLCAALICAVNPLRAGDDGFGYIVPEQNGEVFSAEGLGMIMAEREEYSRNLAATANQLLRESALSDDGELQVDAKKAEAMMPLVNRLMALAVELSPRTKATIVINHQLKKGLVAKHYKPEVQPRTLASLMQMRATRLLDEGGAENIHLAGCLLDLAVALDPQNEDAIFGLELLRMDGHAPDWAKIGRAE
ncbi:hypothetical protein [Sulfuriroseicoccus oceanibius]|uniref:Uncharacterized protein n=1 Tax=Sulfuriroseicoccus oceanibius TaxID=2707525 RepID=A0A7T7JBH2_9BACT|nr:hypothetical protein [Sulfuriroseicoccus oceanibius]QQL44258.1 hypothetical protein G3M56_010170 [Sulfuriroseicoccus oceanibius]